MDDMVFFGGAFRWQPSEVKKLRWSWRKQMRQAYEDNAAKSAASMEKQ